MNTSRIGHQYIWSPILPLVLPPGLLPALPFPDDMSGRLPGHCFPTSITMALLLASLPSVLSSGVLYVCSIYVCERVARRSSGCKLVRKMGRKMVTNGQTNAKPAVNKAVEQAVTGYIEGATVALALFLCSNIRPASAVAQTQDLMD